jgi:hypothetical protein
MSQPFVPARSGINFRLMAFIMLVSSPFVWCAYAGVRYVFNGGIEDHGGYKKIDLKAIGNFNFDQFTGNINDVPTIYRKLDGQRVMLDGYMFSSTGASNVHDFQLVYNIQRCCFGGPPKVQERVFVFCPPGKIIGMNSAYMQMVGTLHVQVTQDKGGAITSVYTMDLENARLARRL